MDNYTVPINKLTLVRNKEYVWRCQLIPGTYFPVEKGTEPNWFHRKMQTLCFGFVWSKIK